MIGHSYRTQVFRGQNKRDLLLREVANDLENSCALCFPTCCSGVARETGPSPNKILSEAAADL